MKESIRSLSNRDGTITTDKSEIAEILNEQFESVFSVNGIEPDLKLILVDRWLKVRDREMGHLV